MSDESSWIRKSFNAPFGLDSAKLSRILGIIDTKFREASAAVEYSFQVSFKNGRQVALSQIDQVFTLDNTVKNPITSLAITFSGEKEGELLAGGIISFSGSSKPRDNVDLSLHSDDHKLGLQLFAELEEQIERTFFQGWIYKVKSFNFLLKLTFFLAILLGMAATASIKSNPRLFPLPTDVVETLLQRSEKATTSEEKINFLFDLNRQQLQFVHSERKSPSLEKFLSSRTFFIGIPILLVLACAVYAMTCCYPMAAFLWGDYKEHYEHLVSLRKNIWWAVVMCIVLGILGNLFVLGITPLLNS